MREPKLYVASHDEIANGDATDIYFKRTQEALRAAGLQNVRVRMDRPVAFRRKATGRSTLALRRP